ncbi:MAG: PmbA/TldA family metallopeptidase, partial [Rhodoferax sp.]
MPNFDPTSALHHARQSAPWAGLRYSRESTQTRAVRNDAPEKNETTLEEGAMCEVLIDGHFGYAATADLSNAGLQRAFDQAISTTRATAGHKVHPFTDAHRAAVRGVYQSPAQKPLANTPLALITDCLLAASKAMAIDANVVNRSAHAAVIQTHIDYYSTNGTHTTQRFDMVDITVAATAAEGMQSQ